MRGAALVLSLGLLASLACERAAPAGGASNGTVIAPEFTPRKKKFTSAWPVAASSNAAPAFVALSKNRRSLAVAAGTIGRISGLPGST